MPHVVADRVKDTSTSTGTGNLTLSGTAPNAFRTFGSVCANNDTLFYCVAHTTANEWEVGLGTYSTTGPALARTTVIASSNSNNAVNFSAGTKDVFITSPAVTQGWGVLTASPSSDQNDYNPTGLATANRLRLTPSASIKLTGLAGGYDGREIVISNSSTDYLVWLENQNTASAAANRFDLPQGFPFWLMPGDRVTLAYSATSSRWQFVSASCNPSSMGLTEFTDFAGGSSGGVFNATNSGTGASVQSSTYLVGTTERTMGLMQSDTGTTATGRSSVGGAGGGSITPTLGPALSVARIAIETTVTGTETFSVISGFADSAGGTWTDGVGWEYRWTGSAAEWSQTRMANASATRSNTGSPSPDNNYIWLVVFVNPGWTRADFIYSTDSVAFTKADSPTTGLPGNTRHTEWMGWSIIKSAGTTQRNLSADLAGCRIDYVRG